MRASNDMEASMLGVEAPMHVTMEESASVREDPNKCFKSPYPLISWWCFPFKPLIGELEAAILKSYIHGANHAPKPSKNWEHAHNTYKGFNYSQASTHLGNSLVLFYPQFLSSPTAGTIQKIQVVGNEVTFVVKQQALVPHAKFDSFKAFIVQLELIGINRTR
ncbi:hypothetical protein B0H10DRAFT_1954225 [Mycena sp. CBHHK59/15]|nr:hypothetical protein B0H10DRAFT_1954225 [Mycena sp. CBHHK59/15]